MGKAKTEGVTFLRATPLYSGLLEFQPRRRRVGPVGFTSPA